MDLWLNTCPFIGYFCFGDRKEEVESTQNQNVFQFSPTSLYVKDTLMLLFVVKIFDGEATTVIICLITYWIYFVDVDMRDLEEMRVK